MSALDELGELGDDLDGGEPPARPKRKHVRTRPEGTPRRGGQRTTRATPETRLRESIEAVADWLRDRGDQELGDVLHRDAPKMARVAGAIANVNPAAKRAVTVLADVLEPIRAFGPTLRILWGRFLERRAAHAIEEDVGEYLAEPVPVAAGPEEPAQAEPWRIREG